MSRYPEGRKSITTKLIQAKQDIRKAYEAIHSCDVPLQVDLNAMLEAVGGSEASDMHLVEHVAVRTAWPLHHGPDTHAWLAWACPCADPGGGHDRGRESGS